MRRPQQAGYDSAKLGVITESPMRCPGHLARRLRKDGTFNTANGAQEGMKTFNAFYFSFITLSTVGYGDITPVSKVARMLAAMEAVTGMLYVATLIARLVSLYSAPKSRDS